MIKFKPGDKVKVVATHNEFVDMGIGDGYYEELLRNTISVVKRIYGDYVDIVDSENFKQYGYNTAPWCINIEYIRKLNEQLMLFQI